MINKKFKQKKLKLFRDVTTYTKDIWWKLFRSMRKMINSDLEKIENSTLENENKIYDCD